MEIERKFTCRDCLVPIQWAERTLGIQQGYLVDYKHRTARVRIVDNKSAYLTIKGITRGISRKEYEWNIPRWLGIALMFMSYKFIKKTRYEIRHKSHLWEVDYFHFPVVTTMIAEIELSSEDEKFELPHWVIEETFISNSSIAQVL